MTLEKHTHQKESPSRVTKKKYFQINQKKTYDLIFITKTFEKTIYHKEKEVNIIYFVSQKLRC